MTLVDLNGLRTWRTHADANNRLVAVRFSGPKRIRTFVLL